MSNKIESPRTKVRGFIPSRKSTILFIPRVETRGFLRGIKFILILPVLISFGTAQAGEKETRDMFDLNPITVTASRLERKMSEVSSSVSILSEKDINKLNPKSTADLLKNMPGVYFYDPSGVGGCGAVVNMRGFYGNMTSQQLVLVNGIPKNKGKDKLIDWDMISLDNIERIELVRGPASALYGDNAMSGVINIITKKPAEKLTGSSAASYGSYNLKNYQASFSGTSDRTGYLAGVSRKTTDGFRSHCDYARSHLDTQLSHQIGPGKTMDFSLDYYETNRGALSWALSEAQIANDRRQARPGTENDTRETKKIEPAITYKAILNGISNIEGVFYFSQENAKSFYTSGSTGSSTKEQLEEEETFGLLPRLNINPEIKAMEHSFTAGLDLERNNFDYKEYAAPYHVRGAISSYYKVTRDKVGPYLQDEIKLLNGSLKLIPGIRYDLVRLDFNDLKSWSNSKQKSMSKTTPKLGAVYTYSGSSNLYAQYAQAFRTPTIGQMFTYGSSSNPDLEPEEANNLEIGIRHRLNESVKATLSFYRMRLTDEIWYDYSSSKYQNYGKTSHNGLESSLDFKLIRGFSGFMNYTYSNARNESGTDTGNYLTNIPKHKANLGLDYNTKTGFNVSLTANWIGSSYIDSANNDKLPSYTTVDTKISYNYKRFTFFTAIDNCFNEGYNSYGYKSGSTKYFTPATGRTFTFGLQVKF